MECCVFHPFIIDELWYNNNNNSLELFLKALVHGDALSGKACGNISCVYLMFLVDVQVWTTITHYSSVRCKTRVNLKKINFSKCVDTKKINISLIPASGSLIMGCMHFKAT